jgi:hypothetical protein
MEKMMQTLLFHPLVVWYQNKSQRNDW